jgi:hypothetical protein
VTAAVRFVYLAALGTWIGAMAFLSFVVAPTAFTVLEARAGDLVAALFPRYYAAGVSLGVVAVAAALFLHRYAQRPRPWRLAIGALALAVAATAYSGGVVHPQAHRLRATLATGGDEARTAFARAHRTAVVLNGAALLAALVGLGATAAALRE